MHQLTKNILDWVQEKVSPSFYEAGSLNLYQLAQYFQISLYEADFDIIFLIYLVLSQKQHSIPHDKFLTTHTHLLIEREN